MIRQLKGFKMKLKGIIDRIRKHYFKLKLLFVCKKNVLWGECGYNVGNRQWGVIGYMDNLRSKKGALRVGVTLAFIYKSYYFEMIFDEYFKKLNNFK